MILFLIIEQTIQYSTFNMSQHMITLERDYSYKWNEKKIRTVYSVCQTILDDKCCELFLKALFPKCSGLNVKMAIRKYIHRNNNYAKQEEGDTRQKEIETSGCLWDNVWRERDWKRTPYPDDTVDILGPDTIIWIGPAVIVVFIVMCMLLFMV